MLEDSDVGMTRVGIMEGEGLDSDSTGEGPVWELEGAKCWRRSLAPYQVPIANFKTFSLHVHNAVLGDGDVD